VRGLSCSSQAMPFVRERFPTYDAFAKANLAEIYGGDTLKQCLELTCNELRHIMLENRGDRFAIAPLPRLTQIAPVFGIGIADFDRDGHLDLVLAQNFFSPEPETGRFDGGLGAFVRGKGGMQFEFVGARESGIVMPEDQKGLALLDPFGRGSPSVVCSTNNGPVHEFSSGGAPFAVVNGSTVDLETPCLSVRLRGKDGNPTAIGARVELRTPEGKKQVREITAGSGYLSQSSPAAWFTNVPPGSGLVVRWPDGTTQEHILEKTSGRVTIRR
ncbi:MAG TPA: CRTAC1 family protein, partial [Planctomycetota bacterium]|nr:CRTAC1 family protein [Planctomycetota bacterium]